MQQKIVGDIKLTPAEVRNYFSKLPQDSIPFIPTQVEVQIITQEPKISEEEIERVKSQLREYADRVNKGETSFSTLARFYSEDPGTARRGGEGGFTGRGELVPEFANVVFNLTDTKKVSKVFETEFGYHIAQLIEKRGDRVNYRHILLRPKVDQKDIDAALARLDSIADDIRKNKFTFDDAATWISQDKDTRNNHGLLANPQSSTSRFEMQQLAGLISHFRRTENFTGSHIQIDIFIDPASATLLHPPPVLERVIDQRIGRDGWCCVSSQFRIFTVFNVISSTVPLATPLATVSSQPIAAYHWQKAVPPPQNPEYCLGIPASVQPPMHPSLQTKSSGTYSPAPRL